MPARRGRSSVTTVLVVLSLVGAFGVACGESDTDEGTPQARPPTTTSPVGPSSPATLDGSWTGPTSSGETFSFTVRADTISEVSIPTLPCGVGIASTIQTDIPIQKNTFQVEALPLPYQIYPKDGGQPVQAQDEVTVTGAFVSEDKAEGTITVTVVTDQGVTDSCEETWTADRS